MAYSFDDAAAPERHTTQYFEIIGNRGLYQDGWLARATVKLPWETTMMNTVAADDGWELYNTLEDFSLTHNLAAEVAVRARSHYQKAATLLPNEDRRSMVAAECMGAVYWRLLRQMEQAKFRVLDPMPMRLSRPRKLAIVLAVWLRSFTASTIPNYGRD